MHNAAYSLFTILQSTMDAGAKPSQVSMQRESRSITSVQIHVTNTKVGHGRPKKKRKFSEEVIHGQREAKEHSPRPSNINHSLEARLAKE